MSWACRELKCLYSSNHRRRRQAPFSLCAKKNSKLATKIFGSRRYLGRRSVFAPKGEFDVIQKVRNEYRRHEI